MGTIRESCDPEMQFPSSLFFGSDFPPKPGVLVDDLCEKVIVHNPNHTVSHFDYDEWVGGECIKFRQGV